MGNFALAPRILKESWWAIMIVRGVRSLFVVCFLVCCNAFSLSPHDFSERLKIYNFGNNKKVSSRREDVQQKKN